MNKIRAIFMFTLLFLGFAQCIKASEAPQKPRTFQQKVWQYEHWRDVEGSNMVSQHYKAREGYTDASIKLSFKASRADLVSAYKFLSGTAKDEADKLLEQENLKIAELEKEGKKDGSEESLYQMKASLWRSVLNLPSQQSGAVKPVPALMQSTTTAAPLVFATASASAAASACAAVPQAAIAPQQSPAGSDFKAAKERVLKPTVKSAASATAKKVSAKPTSSAAPVAASAGKKLTLKKPVAGANAKTEKEPVLKAAVKASAAAKIQAASPKENYDAFKVALIQYHNKQIKAEKVKAAYEKLTDLQKPFAQSEMAQRGIPAARFGIK